jgi:hypothetical protein
MKLKPIWKYFHELTMKDRIEGTVYSEEQQMIARALLAEVEEFQRILEELDTDEQQEQPQR